MNRKSRREFLKASIGIGTGVVAAAACAQSPDLGNNKQDFFKVVHSRRSVRAYKPDTVPTQDIERILESAKLCPTAGNRQPWKFLIIQDKDKIELFRNLTLEQRQAISREVREFNSSESQFQALLKMVQSARNVPFLPLEELMHS